MLEKQEAAKVFGEIGFKVAGDIIQQMGWEGKPEAVALHALVGGLMADINGGTFGEGLTTAAINEILIARLTDKNNALGLSANELRLISAIAGGAVSGAIGGNAGQGAGIADSATANNMILHVKNDYSALTGDERQQMLEELKACETEEERASVREKYAEINANNSAHNTQNSIDGEMQVEAIKGPDGEWYTVTAYLDDNGNIEYIMNNNHEEITFDEFKQYGENPPRVVAERAKRQKEMKAVITYLQEKNLIEMGRDLSESVVVGYADSKIAKEIISRLPDSFTLGKVPARTLGPAGELTVMVNTTPASSIALKNVAKCGVISVGNTLLDVYVDCNTFHGEDLATAIGYDLGKNGAAIATSAIVAYTGASAFWVIVTGSGIYYAVDTQIVQPVKEALK